MSPITDDSMIECDSLIALTLISGAGFILRLGFGPEAKVFQRAVAQG